jgi:hypothetical protein
MRAAVLVRLPRAEQRAWIVEPTKDRNGYDRRPRRQGRRPVHHLVATWLVVL